jgi:hypothetical protein
MLKNPSGHPHAIRPSSRGTEHGARSTEHGARSTEHGFASLAPARLALRAACGRLPRAFPSPGVRITIMLGRHVVGLGISSLFSRIAKFFALHRNPVFRRGFFVPGLAPQISTDFHRFQQEGCPFEACRLPCMTTT